MQHAQDTNISKLAANYNIYV